MSETTTPAKPQISPTQSFEALTLLSYRWTQLVENSPVMAGHGITVPAFAVLAAAAAEPGSATGKIARKAGVSKTGTAPVLRALRSAGLIDETRSAEGKGRTLKPTEKGQQVLAAMRTEMATLAGQLPEANWRAVPRVAALARRTARLVNKAEATED